MRYCEIIIWLFIVGCKPAQLIGTVPYHEDLSIHRPPVRSSSQRVDPPKERNYEFTPLTGHIKAELDSIVRISVAQNEAGKLVEGFIIQVYTGNDRNMASQIRNKIASLFPDMSPKISYRQPNFQVKVGRFTNRLKAHKALWEVKETFPKALLVPGRITISYE